jgi:hypothetical protein
MKNISQISKEDVPWDWFMQHIPGQIKFNDQKRLIGSETPINIIKKLLLIQLLLVPGMGKNFPNMPLTNWPNSFGKESTLMTELAIYC